MQTDPKAVTRYLHDHIPITRHLGVTVEQYDGRTLLLAAPLEPNLNHRETAFGGSIASLAILACWSLVHLRLTEEEIVCRLVIQNSSLDFLAPAEDDFQARCTLPDDGEWEKFKRALTKKRKARLRLRSEVLVASKIVAVHDGAYVASIQT